ncbi:DHH family phosphoesterase [Lactobacillus johnsonii]|jgi:c-di-AMP phosphodiesterase-like protein|uniref:Cyclic-di-AMP phosphodiesterase n=1 Tax=Lactobacillus johnsonii ATCC 33200 TaxID=525330 RepID=C2E410_LACJH|nr:DHH family phosphoesterase [Lactobacillus johnsonii]AXQ20039.1 DHH family phosphoesterase [Lactobacillus johnsonii]EEJ60462.1 DHHA1 domain protein [Lactobacillus johnsonii ATCC 33200]KRK54290.1 DHH family phosphoesterase [Lactobacillus johnsonii ATCC 33200]MCF0084263.1 DHH family phosphoesterase [Lactobacillus johnsonii]MCT3323669.1 DHH family phosphoesterase [Lactobacillus johnsonii]
MKGFLRKLELPEFVKDTRLTASLIIVLVLSLLGAIIGTLISPLFGLAMVLLFILTIIFVIYGIYVLAGNTNNYAANLSYRIKRGEQEAMIKMPLGIMLYDKDRQIQWINPYLQMYLHGKDIIGSSISSVDKELAKYVDDAIKSNSNQNKIIKWGDRKFEMVVQDDLGVVYLLDITLYANIEEKYKQERLAIGLIFIDNYDELSQSMSDQNLTNMSSYVQNALSNYAGQFNSYLKRIDEDHFILLTHMHDLAKMEEDKFSILDKVRTESSRKNMPLTLSIGIAFGSESLNEIADQAQSNLDLALGRGGDQVVVKQSGHEAHFYGGKSNPMEKRTRVRARMVSQALVELFKGVDHVFVQGHRNPDLDAIGSAIGIVKIARIHGVKASVVLDVDHVNYDVGRLIAKMQAAGIDKDVFISPKDALEEATDESLLVLTDHSKYSITYDPELYDRLKNRLIIIDHHRRGEEFPENPMLVYIEPYASSTCELVTEMIEYQPQGGEGVLTDLEASAMLAGITVDSKEFSLRTGTRTFDAASYLRSIGADTQVVSELLKENIDNYLQRSHLVSTIDMIEPDMALLVGEENKLYDPIITAQAADTALSLEHVDASFALTRRSKDAVGISARSMGNVNVQVIMEKLGGGGHLSNAATQLKGITIEEAKVKLLEAVNDYLKENE